jgi:hypothetical protein
MKRTFTYEEAANLLPAVQRLTNDAVAELEKLAEQQEPNEPEELDPQYEEIVGRWAEAVMNLGIEVKGLWLIDFDCGSGYYCWKHPEPGLQYFHGYEEGFSGRVKLN